MAKLFTPTIADLLRVGWWASTAAWSILQQLLYSLMLPSLLDAVDSVEEEVSDDMFKESCITEQTQYFFDNDERSYAGVLDCGNCSRMYRAEKLPNTNLVFLITDAKATCLSCDPRPLRQAEQPCILYRPPPTPLLATCEPPPPIHHLLWDVPAWYLRHSERESRGNLWALQRGRVSSTTADIVIPPAATKTSHKAPEESIRAAQTQTTEGPDLCELAQNPRYRKGPDVCFDNDENDEPLCPISRGGGLRFTPVLLWLVLSSGIEVELASTFYNAKGWSSISVHSVRERVSHTAPRSPGGSVSVVRSHPDLRRRVVSPLGAVKAKLCEAR
ncbi:hypothetical protein CRUP_019712 [Coryphaenoides rupestris]|nr:hypothetical protein CRUP_019712 [Coryphaenoides rupestris]